MTAWQAFVRGIRQALGLPDEPIDYSPEAQLIRVAERLECDRSPETEVYPTEGTM